VWYTEGKKDSKLGMRYFASGLDWTRGHIYNTRIMILVVVLVSQGGIATNPIDTHHCLLKVNRAKTVARNNEDS